MSHEQRAKMGYVSEFFRLVVSKVPLTFMKLLLLLEGHCEMTMAQVPTSDGRQFIIVTEITLPGPTSQMQPVVVAVDLGGQPA